MASSDQVRQYLAYWFQLGKRVMIQGGREALLPQSVIQGDRYSPEFETIWEKIISGDVGDCYLEGTPQTISQLFSSTWNISPCARCSMPVPMIELGLPPVECPCADLEGWPDTGLPQPRSPVNNQDQLQYIRERLIKVSHPGV